MSPKAKHSLASRIEKLGSFYRRHQRMPSYAEMAALFSFRSKNAVSRLVQKLLKKGILSRDRTGHLIPRNLVAGLKVLGNVQAGFPSPAEEELLDTLSLDAFLIQNPEASYMLKVSGDSMIDAGIQPGDLVIVDRSRPVHNGDIVVVQADGEWTMKYYFRQKGKIQLRAANTRYPVFTPRQELIMGGIVIACVRKYGN